MSCSHCGRLAIQPPQYRVLAKRSPITLGARESLGNDDPTHGVDGEPVMTPIDLDIFCLCVAR